MLGVLVERVAQQAAVLVGDVGAHAAQGRRVGVDRDRRRGAVMADPVDVGGAELEDPAGTEHRGRGGVEQAQALLDDLALEHRDRSGGAVVVVEAGVVAGHPADEPHGHVLVGDEAVERAPVRVVADVGAPELGPLAEPAREHAQLVADEVAAGGERRAGHAATAVAGRSRSSAAGLSWTIARRSAGASGAGSAYGQSEPCTSAPEPTARTIASTATGP